MNLDDTNSDKYYLPVSIAKTSPLSNITFQ